MHSKSFMFSFLTHPLLSTISLPACFCMCHAVKQMVRARMTARRKEGERGKQKMTRYGSEKLFLQGEQLRNREVADVVKTNDLVEFATRSWRAPIKPSNAQSRAVQIRGRVTPLVSYPGRPILLISSPIKTCLFM